MIGKSVLQSTFSDGHCFGPDFDISVIKGKFHHKPFKSLKLQFALWTFLICVSKTKQIMIMQLNLKEIQRMIRSLLRCKHFYWHT